MCSRLFTWPLSLRLDSCMIRASVLITVMFSNYSFLRFAGRFGCCYGSSAGTQKASAHKWARLLILSGFDQYALGVPDFVMLLEKAPSICIKPWVFARSEHILLFLLLSYFVSCFHPWGRLLRRTERFKLLLLYRAQNSPLTQLARNVKHLIRVSWAYLSWIWQDYLQKYSCFCTCSTRQPNETVFDNVTQHRKINNIILRRYACECSYGHTFL